MTSFSKVFWRLLIFAKILWIGTRRSICFCNKAVANDDLLSLFTTSRKVANGSRYPFGVLRPPKWYQWQPMAVNGTHGNQWQSMVPTVKLPLVLLVKLRTYPKFVYAWSCAMQNIVYDKLAAYQTCLCIDSAYAGKINLYHIFCWSNLILCLYNINTLNICKKKFDAKKLIFNKMTALWT